MIGVEPGDSWSAQEQFSEYEDEQLARGIEESRASYTRDTYASGSSKEARASSASYSGPKASPASAMPQNGPSNKESSLALIRPSNLDPSKSAFKLLRTFLGIPAKVAYRSV